MKWNAVQCSCHYKLILWKRWIEMEWKCIPFTLSVLTEILWYIPYNDTKRPFDFLTIDIDGVICMYIQYVFIYFQKWLLCAVCTLSLESVCVWERERFWMGVELEVCMVCTPIQFISRSRRIKKIASLSLAPLPVDTIRKWTSRVTFYVCIQLQLKHHIPMIPNYIL